MDKETFEKAKSILGEIEKAKETIEKIDKTDEIYYKTPDMDGGFTQGSFVKFYGNETGELKEYLKDFYRKKITVLNKRFEEL